MLRTTSNNNHNIANTRRSFTIPELLVSAAVMLFLIAYIVEVYVLGLATWYVTINKIEAQRIVQLTLLTVKYGVIGYKAGTDTLQTNAGPVTYGRRRGLAWARPGNDDPSYPPTYPVVEITSDADKELIVYRLYDDYSFFVGTFKFEMKKTESPMRLYQDQAPVKGTDGLTGISFQSNSVSTPSGMVEIIRVTATVERSIRGIGARQHNIKVEDTADIYLRNT